MKEQVLGYIPDGGYCERGVINAARNFYPRVTIRFAPPLQDELDAYGRVADKLIGLPLRRHAANFVAAHLKEWDLTDDKGQVVPITPDHLLRVKQPLFNRLFSVVSLHEAPDDVPDRTGEELDGDLADQFEAAQTGRPVAAVREERLRKNS